MTNITAALDAFRPELEARFVAFVTRSFERLIEAHGPALRGVYNGRDVNVYRNTVSAFTQRVGGGSGSISDPVELNTDRLNTAAVEYAQGVVLSWAAKIEAKLGQLDDAELVRGDGATFTLSGTRAGRRVVITQDMIVNVSGQGTLYNQFPARIYVDGKFTPAAKFAAL